MNSFKKLRLAFLASLYSLQVFSQNNTNTIVVAGAPSQAKPDLVLSNAVQTFENMPTGLVRMISVDITNKGDAAALLDLATIGVYGNSTDVFVPENMKGYCGASFPQKANQQLQPGQTITKKFSCGLKIVPMNYYVIWIDPNNKIAEKEEQNNHITFTMQPPFQDAVQLYEHGNYGGKQLSLWEGNHDLSDIEPFWNDRVSSIKVPIGYQVVLYENDKNSGSNRSITISPSWIPDLASSKYKMNDKASYIEIKKVSQ